MNMLQKRVVELTNKLNLSLTIVRALVLLVIISLTINSVLAIKLYQSNLIVHQPKQIIVGTGSLEKIDDTLFEIIPDEEFDMASLPPIPYQFDELGI